MIDKEKLKEFFGDNEARIEKFIQIFKTQTPKQLEDLEKAIDEKDWEQSSILAHSIKTQLGYMSLVELKEIALKIEKNAEKQENTEEIKSLFEKLNSKIIDILQNS